MASVAVAEELSHVARDGPTHAADEAAADQSCGLSADPLELRPVLVDFAGGRGEGSLSSNHAPKYKL